jgi:hypothetical protein
MGQVMELIVFDEARALKMLVGSTDKIGVAQVLSQLAGVRHRQLQHKYLDMLFDKDPRAGANFHELQVELYADFDQVPCVRARARMVAACCCVVEQGAVMLPGPDRQGAVFTMRQTKLLPFLRQSNNYR